MNSKVRPPVVVGVDDSPAAWCALERAAREAQVRGLPLHVVHVTTDGKQAETEALLTQARARVSEVAASVEASFLAPAGPPVAALLDASGEATLLALGSRGSGGFRGMLMGSVAAAIARHAQVPVLVVRDLADTSPERAPRVIAGVDGFERSQLALRFGFEEASLWRMPLHAVYVRPTHYEADVESAEQAQLLLAETVAGWREKYPDVDVTVQVREGHPAQELVHASTGAELLVVAARGTGGFPGLTLGSVSHVVLLHAYFFEAFLVGRSFTEPPDITARICGICPVAYQMSACAAIEDACGIAVPEPIRALRRLLYCGEWIESHTLHIYLLHAPDFLGYPSVIAMATDHRDLVERGLALKKTGNEIMEVVGGRAIHPVNVRVGGFYRAPTRSELAPLAERLRRAREQALDTVRWVAGFDAPEFTHDHELLALHNPGEYPIDAGTLRSSGGLAFPPAEFDRHIVEDQVPHSTALHARLTGRGRYLVGPTARYTLNHQWLSPLAKQAAAEAGLGADCRNPFRSIVVRAVEVLYAVDEALRVIDSYEPPDPPSVKVPPRAGVGHGVTEAPRGVLYHRYELDEQGRIVAARIVPPTSQNQASIEHDLGRLVEARLQLVISENVLRFVVIALPVFMPLPRPANRAALGVYAVGILAYVAAWLGVVNAPDSAWSTSLVGFTAPAYTSLIWLTGIGIDSRLRHVSRYRPWMYLVVSALFTAVHTWHTTIIWARTY